MRCWRLRGSSWSARQATGRGRWRLWVGCDRTLLLLDVQLPGIDGFGVAELLSQAGDGPVVVLISSREAAVYGARIAQSPAAGFLAKGALSGATLRQLLV